jgi:hypothetical protein
VRKPQYPLAHFLLYLKNRSTESFAFTIVRKPFVGVVYGPKSERLRLVVVEIFAV